MKDLILTLMPPIITSSIYQAIVLMILTRLSALHPFNLRYLAHSTGWTVQVTHICQHQSDMTFQLRSHFLGLICWTLDEDWLYAFCSAFIQTWLVPGKYATVLRHIYYSFNTALEQLWWYKVMFHILTQLQQWGISPEYQQHHIYTHNCFDKILKHVWCLK